MRFVALAIFCVSAKERTDLKHFSEEDRIFKKCQEMENLKEYEDKILDEMIIPYSFGTGDGNDNNFVECRWNK